MRKETQPECSPTDSPLQPLRLQSLILGSAVLTAISLSYLASSLKAIMQNDFSDQTLIAMSLSSTGFTIGLILIVYCVRRTAIDVSFVIRHNRELKSTIADKTQKLDESEARVVLAVRGSSDGLWDWNILTNEIHYIPQACGMLDLRDKGFAITLDEYNDSLHPDDFQRTWRILQRHLEHREPYDVEHRLRTKAGEYRWFRSQGQAIWNENGEPVRMAGSVTDIHRQKSAEFALKHERFLLDTLLNNLPDAIYFKDSRGRFSRVSSSLAKHLGARRADELIGRTDEDCFPADYAEQAKQDEDELLRGVRTSITKEEHPQWHDGSRSWVLTTKIPLRDDHGQIIGTFGISRDISVLKQAEERFRQVINAAPNPLLLISAAGTVQLANSAAEKLFGYSRSEISWRCIQSLIPEWSNCSTSEKDGSVTKRQISEGLGQHRDGASIPIEIRLSHLTFGTEKIDLVSILDLTDRKQSEQALVAAKEVAEAAFQAFE